MITVEAANRGQGDIKTGDYIKNIWGATRVYYRKSVVKNANSLKKSGFCLLFNQDFFFLVSVFQQKRVETF